MLHPMSWPPFALIAAFALASCAGSAPPPAPSPSPAANPAPVAVASGTPAPPPQPTREEAHKLLVLAASCWLGGLWADALGEQDSTKQAGIHAQCSDLARRVWNADDKAHLEQLRAFEANAVSDVTAKVDLAAKDDSVDSPRRDALVKLTAALGDAARETTLARRAGDRVKRDLEREPEKLTGDEVSAVSPLREHAKLDALLKLDAGDLSKEAHALGLLFVLDRVELARGLPKHLKLYAVADAFQLVFGVTVPDVPQDGSKKLVPGTWLKFLSDTASAAGHAVSDKAKTPREKDALAWAGMLEGLSDKLKADADGIATTTDLSKVVTVTLHRLETEYKAQQAAEATKQKPADKHK
jgi:hypothetical protein